MDPRFLLTELPPELRNLIYSNTVSEDNQATNLCLPFQSKKYDSSHTEVVIVPVHRGNPNLLALQKYRFQEATEYRSWLMTTAIELRISVLFKGREDTFIQEHWDKKMTTHLKKLAKKYAWFSKASRYDIQILWEPKVWTCRKRTKSVGAVANRMVEVLMQAMDENRKKNGIVKANLLVGNQIAFDYVLAYTPMGLKDFVSPDRNGFRTQIREVRILPKEKGPCQQTGEHGKCDLPSLLKPIPQYDHEKEGRFEDWEALKSQGDFVFRRERNVEGDAVEYREKEQDWNIYAGLRWTLTHECIPTV